MTEHPPDAVARFAGTIREGQLKLDDPARWRAAMPKLEGTRIQVTLDRERRVRNNPQLKRYFIRIVPVVRAVLNVGRVVPLSKWQVHEVLCGAFIGHEETPIGIVRIESKTLSPAQFATYCDQIEAHFTAEFGVRFPEIGESLEVAL